MVWTTREIEQAILGLSPTDRERLFAWMGEAGDRMAESAPVYDYGAVPQRHNLSVEEYLRLEEQAQIRHEYVAGEIYAMAGASDAHNTIAGNVFTVLKSHLRGGPCRVYISEFKARLRIANDDIFYYPDVMVSCHPDRVGQYHTDAPTLVVEVLSRSTEAIDRREKLMNYRQAETLEEYCLIAQDRREVTLFSGSGAWRPEIFTLPEASIELRSVRLALPLADIYADVRCC